MTADQYRNIYGRDFGGAPNTDPSDIYGQGANAAPNYGARAPGGQAPAWTPNNFNPNFQPGAGPSLIQGGQVNYPGGTSGLNPSQFATPGEAARLAKLFGGTASGDQLAGPGYGYVGADGQPITQQQINVPGAPSPLNAGLVSEALARYGGDPGSYGYFQVMRDLTGNYGAPNPWDNNPRPAPPAATQAGAPTGPGAIQRPTPAGSGTTKTPPRTSIPGTSGGAPAGSGQKKIDYTKPLGSQSGITSGTGTGQQQTSNAIKSRGGLNLGSAGTDNPDPNAGYSNINTGYWPDSFMADNGWTRDASGQWQNSQPWANQGLPQYGDPNGAWSQDPTTGQWIQAQTTPGGGQDTGVGGGGGGTGGGGGGAAPPGPGTGFPPSGHGYVPNSAYQFQNPYGVPRAKDPYGAGSPVQPIYNRPGGEDLQYKAENDRAMAINQGLALQGDLGDYTNYQQGRANDYEGAANSAYGGIASGYGGRTDEEKSAIQQQPKLDAMQLSDEQKNSNFLTDEEKGNLTWTRDENGNLVQTGTPGITGDPYAPYRQLGLDEASIDASTGSRNTAVRGAYGAGAAGIDSGLSGTATGVRDAIYDNRGKQYQNLSDAAALTRGAQSDAASNVRGALNYGEDTTRSYVDPSKLGLSDQYKNDYSFGERDVQNLRDKAGRDIGSQEAMDTERLIAGANANGNVSPLAIAAQRAKIRQQSAVNQANAMSDAEIAGKKLQLDTTQQKENTRLGAESNYANLGTGTELALGGRRAGAEQTLGAQNLSNEQNLTGETLATQNTLGAAEQGAEQYLGNQKQQAEQFKTATNVGAEQALGAAGTEAEKFKTSTNLGAGQTAEKAGSDRAAQIATNRQAVSVGNQQSQLGRQQFAYGATAQNNTDFSNQRRADEGEYRGYLTGQGTQANQNAQVGAQQRLSAYGAQMGAQNAATGNAIKNYGTPSGDSVTGAYGKLLGLAKGGVERGPQTALVGEAGPELVIDLGVPHYDGGTVIDPYAQQDFYAQGGADADPYGATTMTGPRPSNAQVKQTATMPNPLWEKIKRGIGDYQQYQADGGQQQQSPNGGILGLAMKALPMFLAHGGVVKPGGHPYGHRGMPHAELVTHPEIRTLGQYGPQAVVPLRHRPGNRVNVEDIPQLERQYAGYGA